MLCGELAPTAGRHADHERDRELAARHVADGGRVVENLVEREQAEVDRHHLDDRAHARECRADAGADERRFREWRVADTLLAEFREQPHAHRIAASVAPDVLAHQEHTRIALQRLTQRRAHCLAVSGFDRSPCHDCAPSV